MRPSHTTHSKHGPDNATDTRDDGDGCVADCSCADADIQQHNAIAERAMKAWRVLRRTACYEVCEAESESEDGRVRSRYWTSSWLVFAEAVALHMSNEDIVDRPQCLDVALGKGLAVMRCYRGATAEGESDDQPPGSGHCTSRAG